MNEAIEDLYREMGEQCLPAPPIPSELANSIRKVGEQQWGTEEFDPLEQYLHASHLGALVVDRALEAMWLFGYSGHGVNSRAYSLTCRLGPLILAMQGHWVPWKLYNLPTGDAAELAGLFQVAQSLIQIAAQGQGPPRVLVDASRFRDGYFVRPIAKLAAEHSGPWGSDGRVNSLDQVSEMAIQLMTEEDPDA